MKRYIILVFLLTLFVGSSANATLWNYYQERGLTLPSVQSRSADALVCGIEGYQGTALENSIFERCLREKLGETKLGSVTSPVAGTTYNLAGSGVTASATSITLTSLTIPQTGYRLQDSDFSTTFYLTFEPGSLKRQEIASCTTIVQNASNTQATLSGCVRGLSPFTPYNSSSSMRFAHGGGTTVIFSDPPQLFNEFASKLNNETVTGTWTFYTDPIASSSSHITGDPSAYVTLYAMNQATSSGGSNASTLVKGVVQEATDSMLQSSSSTGSTGARTFANGGSFAQTSTANKAPVLNGQGKLDPNDINTSSNYVWSGTHTFNNTVAFTTTTASTSTITGKLTVPAPVNATDAASLHYVTSSIATATSSVMNGISRLLFATTTPIAISSLSTEVAIIATTSIPGNTLGTSGGTLRVRLNMSSLGLDNTRNYALKFYYGGTALVTINSGNSTGIQSVGGGIIDFILTNTTATNAQSGTATLVAPCATWGNTACTGGQVAIGSGTSVIDSTVAQNLVITVKFSTAVAQNLITIDSSYIEIIR